MLLKKYWLYCFLCLLIADAIALILHWKEAHFLLKFLLMPVLIIGLLHNKSHLREKNWRLILAGLITSWAGDVLLLFSENMQLFFILGLVCFLCTHLAYIIYFSRYHNGIFQQMGRRIWLTITVGLYSLLLLWYLWPGLGDLRIPVIIYTIVITVMALQALFAKLFLPYKIGNLFAIGAMAFIISDSLLAIDKFNNPFFLSNALIMVTYGIAQLTIVYGAIINRDTKLVQQTVDHRI